jgi:hypothetical protein
LNVAENWRAAFGRPKRIAFASAASAVRLLLSQIHTARRVASAPKARFSRASLKAPLTPAERVLQQTQVKQCDRKARETEAASEGFALTRFRAT